MNRVKMKWVAVFLLAGGVYMGFAAEAVRPPRIAVWNPEVGTYENRSTLSLAYLDQVSAWLRADGCEVLRLTTAQLNDPVVFTADTIDAWMIQGSEFPRAAIPALQRYHDAGGVLIALGAKVPFLMALERKGDAQWSLSPPTPAFAWQDSTLQMQVGTKYIYDPLRHDQGWNHTATPLLKRYLPDAPDLRGVRLPGWWVVPWPQSGNQPAEYFPLIRSQRFDGVDVPPQLFVVRRGKRHAILGLDPRYTDASDSGRWPLAQKTLVALAKIARDLHDGTLVLEDSMRVSIPVDLSPSEPLQTRMPTGSVNPDAKTAWRRWGLFDGASHELGPALPSGAVAALDSTNGILPRMLSPGSTLRMRLSANAPASLSLRVRGAFMKSGAALRIVVDGKTLWHERFNAVDASGAGNWGVGDVGNVATEFNRIVFLPSPAGAELAIANPGDQPLYFDAMQLEPTGQGGDRLMSLNYGYYGGWPKDAAAPPALTKGWQHLRLFAKTETVGAPGTPDAFAQTDAEIDRALSIVPTIDMLLQGTPEWAAMSPERYAQAKARGRPHCTAPDPEKYAVLVRHLVEKYRDRVDRYEIWNEAESNHFYYGSHAEYITFFKRIAALIKELDPGATIITTGMAGFSENFVTAMHDAKAYEDANLIAFHPYAGQSPGWDVIYGLMEGSLYAKGIGTTIYCNESGFPYRNIEWFTKGMTPYRQMRLYDIAVSRLLANGVTQLSIFHAGGDGHVFGLVDAHGEPRPAYAVYADYLSLGTNGATRADFALSAADGGCLQGVYSAGAVYADGSLAVVVNPSEIERFQPVEPAIDPSIDFSDGSPGDTFFGVGTLRNGRIVVTPAADKAYVGYTFTSTVDLGEFPLMEVVVPACSGKWNLSVGEGKDLQMIFQGMDAEPHRLDLRNFLKSANSPANLRFTFRVYGTAEIERVVFLSSAGKRFDAGGALAATHRPEPDPIPVILRAPMPGKGPVSATATREGRTVALKAERRGSGEAAWVEVKLDLAGRMIVRVAEIAESNHGE